MEIKFTGYFAKRKKTSLIKCAKRIGHLSSKVLIPTKDGARWSTQDPAA